MEEAPGNNLQLEMEFRRNEDKECYLVSKTWFHMNGATEKPKLHDVMMLDMENK